MKILSLNGGGTSGYMTTLLLARLEKELGNKYKCYELFDMIGGVSTGSIIGGLLAKGLSAEEVVAKYEEFMPKIFAHKRWLPLWNSVYKRDAFEKIAIENLNIDIKDCKTRFVSYAVCISQPEMKPKFWKSWRDSIPLYKIALASSAAPVFFDPYEIDGKYYIDGGLACNNPSLCVISDAIQLGADSESLFSLNIACEKHGGFRQARKMKGILPWIKHLPETFLYAGSGTENYQASTLISGHYSIRPEVSFNLDNMDLKAMRNVSEKVWLDHGDELIKNLEIT
jgi:patatin-like phospholipase/acyl hydrolase